MASVNLLNFTCHSLHHSPSLRSSQQTQSQPKLSKTLANIAIKPFISYQPAANLLVAQVHPGMTTHQHSLEVIKDLGVHGRGHDIPVADAVLAMLFFQVIL